MQQQNSNNNTTTTKKGILDPLVERLIRFTINKQISQYAQQVQRDEIEAKIANNSYVKLYNIVLDSAKVNEGIDKELPFQFGMILLHQLEININLKDILNSPITVGVNGIEIELLPRTTAGGAKERVAASNGADLGDEEQEELLDEDDEEIELMSSINQRFNINSDVLLKLEDIVDHVFHNSQVTLNNASIFIYSSAEKKSDEDGFLELNISSMTFSFKKTEKKVEVVQVKPQVAESEQPQSASSAASAQPTSYFSKYITSPLYNFISKMNPLESLKALPAIDKYLYNLEFKFNQLVVTYHNNNDLLSNGTALSKSLFSTNMDSHSITIDGNSEKNILKIICNFTSNIMGDIDSNQLDGLNKILNSYQVQKNQSPSSPSKEADEFKPDTAATNPTKDLSISITIPKISYFLYFPLFKSIPLPLNAKSKSNMKLHLLGENIKIEMKSVNSAEREESNHSVIDVRMAKMDLHCLPNGNKKESYLAFSIRENPEFRIISKSLFADYQNLNFQFNSQRPEFFRFENEDLSDSEFSQIAKPPPIDFDPQPFTFEKSIQLSTSIIQCNLPEAKLSLRKSDYNYILNSLIFSQSKPTNTSLFLLSSSNCIIELIYDEIDKVQYDNFGCSIESFQLECNDIRTLNCFGYPNESLLLNSSFSTLDIGVFKTFANYNTENVLSELFFSNQPIDNNIQKSEFKLTNNIIIDDYDYDDYKQDSHIGLFGSPPISSAPKLTNRAKSELLCTSCKKLTKASNGSLIVINGIHFLPSMYLINQFLYWVDLNSDQPNDPLASMVNDDAQDEIDEFLEGEDEIEGYIPSPPPVNNNNIIELEEFIVHYGNTNSNNLRITLDKLVILKIIQDNSSLQEILQFILSNIRISMKEKSYKIDDYKVLGKSYQSKDIQILFSSSRKDKECSKVEIVNHFYEFECTKHEFSILKELLPELLNRFSDLLVLQTNPIVNPNIIKTKDFITINLTNNTFQDIMSKLDLNDDYYSSDQPIQQPKKDIVVKKSSVNDLVPTILFKIVVIDFRLKLKLIHENSDISILTHVSEIIHTTYSIEKDNMGNPLNNNCNKNQNYDKSLVVNISKFLIRDNVSKYYNNLFGPISHLEKKDIVLIPSDSDQSQSHHYSDSDDDDFDLKTSFSMNPDDSLNNEIIFSLVLSSRTDNFCRTYYNSKLYIAPMFISAHQKTIDFLIHYFEDLPTTQSNFDDQSRNPKLSDSDSPAAELYFDEFIVLPIHFKIDYKPSLELTSKHFFKSKHNSWVFEMIPLNETSIKLPEISYNKSQSLDQLKETLTNEYLQHLLGSQNMFNFITGVAPLNLGIQVGKSIITLIKEPIRNVKSRETNAIYGISKGIGNAMISITVELLTATSKVSGALSKILELGEFPKQSTQHTSQWANQPEGLKQGTSRAANQLYDGITKGFFSILKPIQSRSVGEFVVSLAYIAPGLFLNPALGLTRAATTFSLGIRNALDYTKIQKDKKKYATKKQQPTLL